MVAPCPPCGHTTISGDPQRYNNTLRIERISHSKNKYHTSSSSSMKSRRCDTLPHPHPHTVKTRILRGNPYLTVSSFKYSSRTHTSQTEPFVSNLFDEIPKLCAALHPGRARSHDDKRQGRHTLLLRQGGKVRPFEAVSDRLRSAAFRSKRHTVVLL